MTASANTTLLLRRLGEVCRRRETIISRQERLRASLPGWAMAPLRLVGLSETEVDELTYDHPDAERQAALDEVACERERLDRQIEELEDQLLEMPRVSLEGIQVALEFAVMRLRAGTVSDADGASHDDDRTRVLALVDAATVGLHEILAQDHRLAG
jgi:hypothetical protein